MELIPVLLLVAAHWCGRWLNPMINPFYRRVPRILATGNVFTGCQVGVVIMAPANANDMQQLLNTAYHHPGPALVRYPRDNTDRPDQVDTETTVSLGKGLMVREGSQTALLVFGTLLDIVAPIADKYDFTLVNMRFVKPVDEALIESIAATHKNIVTVEDGCITGGAGSAVIEFLNIKQIGTPCLRLGLSDNFPSQGSRQQVLQEYNLDEAGIEQSIQSFINK